MHVCKSDNDLQFTYSHRRFQNVSKYQVTDNQDDVDNKQQFGVLNEQEFCDLKENVNSNSKKLFLKKIKKS